MKFNIIYSSKTLLFSACTNIEIVKLLLENPEIDVNQASVFIVFLFYYIQKKFV